MRPSMMRVPSVFNLCRPMLKFGNQRGGAPVGEVVGPEQGGAGELVFGEHRVDHFGRDRAAGFAVLLEIPGVGMRWLWSGNWRGGTRQFGSRQKILRIVSCKRLKRTGIDAEHLIMRVEAAHGVFAQGFVLDAFLAELFAKAAVFLVLLDADVINLAAI